MEHPTGIPGSVWGSTSQAKADRKACSNLSRGDRSYAARSCFLFALCFVTLIQCPSKPIVTLPAAESPVLETLLDIDNNAIAAFGAPGVFQMLPGRKIELRFRAMYPTNIQVGIDAKRLPEVTDTAAHPELDGYFHTQAAVPVSSADPRFFWRVLVVLPQAQQSIVNYTLSIFNISQDQNLSGNQKEAASSFTIFRTPNLTPQPSTILFQNGSPVPDQKHDRDGSNGALILGNISLAGWLIATPGPSGDNSIEDIHYSVWLDNDFIERNYGATTAGLNAAIMPGRWFTELDNIVNPKLQIPLTGGQPPNASNFLLPGIEEFTVELNAWHKSKHNGQVPSGWIADPDPVARPDVFWPIQVTKPFGISTDLQEGDYVILTGALVQDSAHQHENAPHTEHYWVDGCWESHYKGQGGWLEIHPVDSVRLVAKQQAPRVRKQPRMIQVCNDNSGQMPGSLDMDVPPEPELPPTDFSQLRFREIVDNRFSDMSSLSQHTVEVDTCDPTKLHLRLVVGPQGHFKAVYLVWWEEGQTKRPAKCTQRPQGTPDPTDLPVCNKKPYLPQCKDPSRDP
jgi:hypothetical protein